MQKQIVAECEAIDQASEQAQKMVDEASKEIEEKVRDISTNYNPEKLTNDIEIISGGTPKTSNPEYWNGSIPWLSVADFNNENRYVEKSEKYIIEKGLKNSNTRYLEKDDLIISARGTVGAMGQLKTPMTFNQSCYGIRTKETITPVYLYYVMKQEINQLKSKAIGVIFDSIIKSAFEGIKIPVPSLSEQKKLVAEVEKLEQKIKKAQETTEESPQKKENIRQLFKIKRCFLFI